MNWVHNNDMEMCYEHRRDEVMILLDAITDDRPDKLSELVALLEWCEAATGLEPLYRDWDSVPCPICQCNYLDEGICGLCEEFNNEEEEGYDHVICRRCEQWVLGDDRCIGRDWLCENCAWDEWVSNDLQMSCYRCGSSFEDPCDCYEH